MKVSTCASRCDPVRLGRVYKQAGPCVQTGRELGRAEPSRAGPSRGRVYKQVGPCVQAGQAEPSQVRSLRCGMPNARAAGAGTGRPMMGGPIAAR